jgi:hypothetical protein
VPTLSRVDTASIVIVGEMPGVHRIWAWQNVVVIVWSGKPSAEAAYMLGPITEQLIARTGAQQLSHVHIVPKKVELPDAATRAAFIDLTQKYGAQTACVGAILDGGGFWASAIRGFITGIRVLAPRTIDLRIHTEMSELAEWFPEEHARRTGVRIEAAELLRQLEYVCSYH